MSKAPYHSFPPNRFNERTMRPQLMTNDELQTAINAAYKIDKGNDWVLANDQPSPSALHLQILLEIQRTRAAAIHECLPPKEDIPSPIYPDNLETGANGLDFMDKWVLVCVAALVIISAAVAVIAALGATR